MSEDTTGKTKSWWEIVAALTPLIIGIGVTGVGSFFTNEYNNRQLQLNQLDALEKLRPLLISENPFDREFAYGSFTALGYEELALKLINLKQDSAGRGVVQGIQLSAPTASAKAEATATLSTLPIQVYVQIANENQKDKAEVIRKALQEKGYVASGIENVAGKGILPKQTNVRYFNDEDKAIADAIVAILKEHGLTSSSAVRVSHYKVKPGSLEIWFSPDAT